jgi:TonB family protein
MRRVVAVLVFLMCLPGAIARPVGGPWESAVAAYIWEASMLPYPQPYTVPPRGKWGAHDCPQQYLKFAALLHYQGAAELLFNIKPDGNAAGMVVAVSSGTHDLDLMSAICVSRWQYEPVTENGKPVEVSWEGQIAWTQNGLKPAGDTPRIALPSENCMRARPPVENSSALKDDTAVRYQLVNGAVTQAAIDHSSGSATLDAHAERCVKTWHFLPVLANGRPATGSYTAVFLWKQP